MNFVAKPNRESRAADRVAGRVVRGRGLAALCLAGTAVLFTLPHVPFLLAAEQKSPSVVPLFEKEIL